MEEESFQMLQAVPGPYGAELGGPVFNCAGCDESGPDWRPWLWWSDRTPKCGKLGLPWGLWGAEQGRPWARCAWGSDVLQPWPTMTAKWLGPSMHPSVYTWIVPGSGDIAVNETKEILASWGLML